MVDPTLRELLEDVAGGATSPAEALDRLRTLPFADLGFARVDHHRQLRQGFPEAVYGPGKTPAQCAAIVAELVAGPTAGSGAGPVLLTRADGEQAAAALTWSPAASTTPWPASPCGSPAPGGRAPPSSPAPAPPTSPSPRRRRPRSPPSAGRPSD